MRPLPVTYQSDRHAVYLPHHPVIKASSSSTPVRVVFDASAKTSTGVALNDVLMTTKTCSASSGENRLIIKIQTYLLSTVTYGTGSASYLSTRCIKQLLEDEGDTYPLAKATASRDFYVDDFLSGAPTVSQAQKLQSQIEALMLKGGFQLSKWMLNCPEALRDVPYSEREIKEPLDFTSTETISALGLQLNPVTDEFSFDVQINSQSISKRSILSEMPKTYNPLGFLAPVTIQAKILMQSLWQLGADWDDSLEENSVAETWREYQRNLTMLTDFRIPRHITSHLQSLDQVGAIPIVLNRRRM
ncbi:uncharacterized protein LOC129809209, partial [Phlebotomus papatasi]|uniref:uncharacterized protein LOC129809209 n=1 Tax=Phlebotomus papatasi TaxID=29031 RepID=UPI002483320B